MKARQPNVRHLTRLLCLLMAFTLLLPPQASAASRPSITAYSAIVIDYNTGEVLYEKYADTMRVPASMTKVMTAYIIFEELEAGNLTLDTMVPISARNAEISRNQARYPTAVPLPAGGSVSVDNLLKLILVPSASASCIVMAEYIAGSEAAFVQRMNATAQRLGMDAQYENCHGAHVHYLTARAQATLVRACIQRFPQMLEYTSLPSITFNGQTYANTNQLLPGAAYAYEGVDGFKTGTINAAGYCLSATATRGNQRIISVVLHSSSNATRHTDSRKLLDYGFQVLTERAPYADVAFHWSRDAVAALKDLGVELHASGNAFRPDQNVTRAEFTTMLYTALEQRGALPDAAEQAQPAPGFTDISGHWAESYITRAAALGLISGVGGGRFAPDSPITRQEMMVLIDRFLDLPEENGLRFSDDGAIALWALESAARVTAAGIFDGSGSRLMPGDTASRAQAATVITRLLERV